MISSSAKNCVDIIGLTKSFGPSEVLKGVDLTCSPGTVTTLIGSSGSGKSTFLRCINFLEVPTTADRFRVLGNELTIHPSRKSSKGAKADKALLARLRKKVSMVFQSFNLWDHMNVRRNVALPLLHVHGVSSSEAEERAEDHLKRVGLSHKGDAYPGFLSGGQKQRVAIARALATDPELMLFDEPTSALDPELVREVLDVIKDLSKEGRTMILVTHELGFAREVSDTVLFLSDGRVEESGHPQELFDRPNSDRLRQFLAAHI